MKQYKNFRLTDSSVDLRERPKESLFYDLKKLNRENYYSCQNYTVCLLQFPLYYQLFSPVFWQPRLTESQSFRSFSTLQNWVHIVTKFRDLEFMGLSDETANIPKILKSVTLITEKQNRYLLFEKSTNC